MASDDHSEHLQFIVGLPDPALQQFCSIALDFIKNGPSRSKFAKAAGKMGVTEQQVADGVDALSHLLCDAAKDSLGPKGFAALIAPYGFTENGLKIIFQVHMDNQADIRKVLNDMSLELPHYHNMHWRLDIQVSSKSLRNTVEPSFMMRLDTKDITEGDASHHLVADFANLQHLHQELDAALKAIKQPQYRRISRSAK